VDEQEMGLIQISDVHRQGFMVRFSNDKENVMTTKAVLIISLMAIGAIMLVGVAVGLGLIVRPVMKRFRAL
jgi:hypothetical protein